MTPLFKKLNLSTQTTIHVLNAPGSFESGLAALVDIAVHRDVSGPVQFAIAFAVMN